jgi:pimeloyl-ACP methyl ester carboxylesterase
MVHGFKSDWAAWSEYLGPEGFLAEVGISGFAVGDGQVEGQMNTGSLDDPTARTNTIHQNAMIIGQTIAQVKQATGAEMVDLLAHSMGGLISRYYIDSLMADRDVAQLIMLGSPMAGTGCAVLPVSLGLFLPASLEIRPSYVTDIFNRQITQRRGIAFHALAGNPILEAFKSPCTTVPSDLLVSQQSVGAIPLEFQTMPVLHTDLNTSAQVFSEFVQPLLTQGPSQYEDLADPPAPVASEPPIQFTRVFTGSLQPGQSQEIVIQIEEGVTVASFALYDTSRTLQVQVRGASGNIIELSAEKNGLVVLEDPAALFYLGYGFKDPRPGAWRVTLFAPAETPAEGAAYALSASMVGGVLLNASVAPLLPQVQEIVNLEAALTLNGEPLPIAFAQVSLRAPDGDSLVFDLDVQESQATLSWQPEMEGLYGIDLLVAGLLPDGTRIERSAFLSIQTQPTRVPTRITLWLAASVGVVILAMPVLGLLLVRRRRRR